MKANLLFGSFVGVAGAVATLAYVGVIDWPAALDRMWGASAALAGAYIANRMFGSGK